MICQSNFVQHYLLNWNLLLHKYFFQSKFVLLLHYMMIELWMLPTPCSCSSNYIIDSISNQICAFILEGAIREFWCFKVTLFPPIDLDFLSLSNKFFTACVACKNQVRLTWFFKNQVQTNRRFVNLRKWTFKKIDFK